jgi:hypothetical protein
MACKNDEKWEETYTYKGSCVKWWELVTLRRKFNDLWDLLKKENRQPNVKYGFSTDEEENAKEQTEWSLADIEGFVSVRFDENGDYDEIYFRITAGDIIRRLNGLGSSYSYRNQVGGQSADFGPWIVYLNDPCYGCTGFRFQHADIPYRRTISCNCMNNGDGCFPNIDIDPEGWKAQCIWNRDLGCDAERGATPISDWQQYCHFNFDWRSAPFYQTKFGDVAKKLFAKEICAPVEKPCTVARNYCCDEFALAHYTEEFMDHSLCPQNETAIAAGRPFNEWPYRKRRLKWVSLGVTLTNPQDEQQPFDDDTFFCCDNTITGGVFKGWVTQKISAIHLTNIWDRVNNVLGGQTLRKCEYEQCDYHPEDNKDAVWKFKEKVPMFVENGDAPDIMDRKNNPNSTVPSCNNCERTDVGEPICACNFNDINGMLEEYLGARCTCIGGTRAAVEDINEKTLSMFGPVDECSCCCKIVARSKSAYLPQYGYPPFNCDSQQNTNQDTTYLNYTVQGRAVIGGTCGGYSANSKDASQTWIVNPVTGRTCYYGPEGTFFLCAPGVTNVSVQSCSAQRKVWSCGQISEQDAANYCEDVEEGQPLPESTYTESLSTPHTAEGAGNINNGIYNSIGFSEIPWGIGGDILIGGASGGNRVFRWGSVAEPFSYRDEHGTSLVGSEVKALEPILLKKITVSYKTGGRTEEEINLTKNQTYILNPPEFYGMSSLEPSCIQEFFGGGIEIKSQGGTCDEQTREPEEGDEGCTISYFGAPNCKQYSTFTYKSSYEYSDGGGGSNSYLCDRQDVCRDSNGNIIGGSSTGSSEITESGQLTQVYTAGCPTSQKCNGSVSDSITGNSNFYDCFRCKQRSVTSNGGGQFNPCTGESSCNYSVYVDGELARNDCNPPSGKRGGFCSPELNCDYSESESGSFQLDPFSDETVTFSGSNSGSVVITGTKVSAQYSSISSSSDGFGSSNFSYSCTAEYSWTGEASVDSDEDEESYGSWKSIEGYPLSWCSGGVVSSCCSGGAAYNYETASTKSTSSGSITYKISIDPTPMLLDEEIKSDAPIKQYETKYQFIVATVSTPDEDCSPVTTYESITGSFTDSSRGEVFSRDVTIPLSASLGEYSYVSHMFAFAQEVD